MKNKYKRNLIVFIVLVVYSIICFVIATTPSTAPFFYLFAPIPVIVLNFKEKNYKLAIFFIIGSIFKTFLRYFGL